MPRVSREQSDSNRAAITAASARLFRERGINGVSVADVTAAAGLTHGGFYGHFASKDALAAEACAAAFEQSVERWHRRVAGRSGVEAARAALVEGYVSARSRGTPGTSCPAAAMAGDVAREPSLAPVRTAYVDGIEHLVAILASVQHAGVRPTDRGAQSMDRGGRPTDHDTQTVHRGAQSTDRGGRSPYRGGQSTDHGTPPTQRGARSAQRAGALADLASMVGALLLARATAGHRISDEFLAAVRERLLSMPTRASLRVSAGTPRRNGARRKPARRPAG